MQTKTIFRCLLILVTLLFAILPGCRRKRPVKIGFVGGITGRVADLGIAGRDGAILAVEQKNKQGGINGCPIQLIIKDDRQDPDTCIEVDRRLLAEGVSAIIGHMTSSMAVMAVPFINEQEILMISPTSSTNDLTGLDDWFYRVYPCSAQTSKLLAEHVCNEMKLKNAFVVYDVTNRAHTQSAYDQFRKAYEACGGKMAGELTFLSGKDVRFMDIAKKVVEKKPDCLYLLTNAMDAAMICQQMDKLDYRIQVISSDWSATDEVLQYGANAVEGMFFFHTANRHCNTPKYLAFKEAFVQRFGRVPDFPSIHTYDCANVILAALEKNDDPKKLRDTIQAFGTFQGVQSQIVFDEYGDVFRDHFPFKIHNGKFELME